MRSMPSSFRRASPSRSAVQGSSITSTRVFVDVMFWTSGAAVASWAKLAWAPRSAMAAVTTAMRADLFHDQCPFKNHAVGLVSLCVGGLRRTQRVDVSLDAVTVGTGALRKIAAARPRRCGVQRISGATGDPLRATRSKPLELQIPSSGRSTRDGESIWRFRKGR